MIPSLESPAFPSLSRSISPIFCWVDFFAEFKISWLSFVVRGIKYDFEVFDSSGKVGCRSES